MAQGVRALVILRFFVPNFSEGVTLTGLHPASRYVIDATDIRLDETHQSKEYTEVETKEGLPQVKATRRSTLQGIQQPTETSLYWDWGPPLPSLCNESQALPDHYRWHLRSLDRDEPGQAGIVPLSQTSLYLTELTPDSRYELTVNLANRAGEWDERRGLRLPQSTLPSNIQGSSGGVGLVAGLLAAAIVFVLLFILLLFLLCRRRLHQSKQQKKGMNETAAMPLMGQMEGLVVGVASSPEHQYEKLNYELMKKTPTDLKLNSLGRACKLASTESLDDDGYLKNNDQRVADDAEVNDDDGHLKNNGQHVAEDEDVDNVGYLRNNDQRKLNPEGMGGYQNMNGNSLGDNAQYLKMTGNSKRGSLQRAPT